MTWAGEPQSPKADPPNAFTVRLVDETGSPVSGAQVGLIAAWGDMKLIKTGWEYFSGSDLKDINITSGNDGIARFAGGRDLLANLGLIGATRNAGSPPRKSSTPKVTRKCSPSS